MRSTEKLWALLEELQQADGDEITRALPLGIPAPMLRGTLLMVADQLPQEPAALDQFLTEVGDFCHGLRSDAPELAA